MTSASAAIPGGPSCSKKAACGLTAGTNGATTSIDLAAELAVGRRRFGRPGLRALWGESRGQHIGAGIEPHQHRVSAASHGRIELIGKGGQSLVPRAFSYPKRGFPQGDSPSFVRPCFAWCPKLGQSLDVLRAGGDYPF